MTQISYPLKIPSKASFRTPQLNTFKEQTRQPKIISLNMFPSDQKQVSKDNFYYIV